MTGHDFNPDNVQPHTGSVISKARLRLRKGDSAGQRHPAGARSAIPKRRSTSTARRRATSVAVAHEPFFLNADPASCRTSRSAISKSPPGPVGQRARRARRPSAGPARRPATTRRNQRFADARQHALRDGQLPLPAHLGAKAKAAFDLTREPEKLRGPLWPQHFWSKLPDGPPPDRGGRPLRHGQPLRSTVFGQSCWDMHADGVGLNNTYLDYERLLCPQFDLGFSALIEDLHHAAVCWKKRSSRC